MKSSKLLVVLLPAFLIGLAIVACETTPLLDMPVYTCPTPFPSLVGLRTPVPLPPTPYLIHPPQDFYRGDAVFVGARGAANRVRFRLQNVYTLPASGHGGTRALYVWSLEIRNLGSMNYATIPIGQMRLTRIQTSTGELNGTWGTSDTAMRAAGISQESYDPLPPNATRIYRMAAYAPVGSPRTFTFTLDEASGSRITWTNATNPYCVGDVAD